MKLWSLLGNSQSLDGGAMFGNVPRALWQRWCTPDEEGRIALSCRSFLLQHGGRNILIEAGVGAFFSPELRQRYGVVEEEHILVRSLASVGVAPEQIDLILLSHLHFDHAGGLLTPFEEGKTPELAFSNAEVLVGEESWARARSPHPRDRASFLPELHALLEQSDRLHVLPRDAETHQLSGDKIRFRTSDGHTPGMLLPTLVGENAEATFCADLIPGLPWIHLPITMGYDRFPEGLIDEKKELYEGLSERSWLLFTHDPQFSAAQVHKDDRGRYCAVQKQTEIRGWDLDREAKPELGSAGP